MNPEVKQKWVAALRSGKYEQTQALLRKGNAFCCLGVLCELAVEENIITMSKSETGTYWYDNDSISVLPEKVCKWAGIDKIGYYKTGDALAFNNDRGANFGQIANIIEKYL